MFNNTDEIIWKQSSDIHINDIIYFVAPYSRIVFKCKVVEINSPYKYKDNNLSMVLVMKMKLIKQYNHDKYTFEYLNSLGIKAIRGLRKINKEISSKLK